MEIATRATLLTIEDPQQDDSTRSCWVYLVPELTVLQVQEPNGIHRFMSVVDGMDLATAIAEFFNLSLDQDAPSDEAITLNRADYDTVRLEVKQGQASEAAEALRRAGLSDDGIDAFVQPQQRGSAVLVQRADQAVVAQGVLIFKGTSGYWMVLVTADEARMIAAAPLAILDTIAGLTNLDLH